MIRSHLSSHPNTQGYIISPQHARLYYPLLSLLSPLLSRQSSLFSCFSPVSSLIYFSLLSSLVSHILCLFSHVVSLRSALLPIYLLSSISSLILCRFSSLCSLTNLSSLLRAEAEENPAQHASSAAALSVRHCIRFAFPLPPWLLHRLHLTFPLAPCRRHCLCIAASQVLEAATDARGQALTVVKLLAPRYIAEMRWR